MWSKITNYCDRPRGRLISPERLFRDFQDQETKWEIINHIANNYCLMKAAYYGIRSKPTSKTWPRIGGPISEAEKTPGVYVAKVDDLSKSVIEKIAYEAITQTIAKLCRDNEIEKPIHDVVEGIAWSLTSSKLQEIASSKDPDYKRKKEDKVKPPAFLPTDMPEGLLIRGKTMAAWKRRVEKYIQKHPRINIKEIDCVISQLLFSDDASDERIMRDCDVSKGTVSARRKEACKIIQEIIDEMLGST